jgi:ketosteroid isomerase-like protein
MVFLALLGCAQVDSSRQRQSLLMTDQQFSAYSVSHGVPAAFRAYMANEATLLPNRAEPVTGKQAIGELLAPLANDTLMWQPRQAEVSRSGELGYTWGKYELRGKDDAGKEIVSHGKYCTIWRKQPDGSWKAILDIGNQSPPPKAVSQ